MLSDKERELVETIRKKVLDRLEYEQESSDEKIEEWITYYLEEETKQDFLPYYRRVLLGKEIFYSLRKLDILQPLLENPHITYYNMIVRKNRSDIFAVGRSVTFMTVNNESKKIENNYEEAYDLIFPPNSNQKNKS